MNTLIAEDKKSASKPRAMNSKADALLKARLFLNAEAQTDRTHFPIIFAERGIRVYVSQSAFPNQN